MQILLVDDHALIRDALRAILTEIAANAVIDEADSACKALELAERDPEKQLIILDLGLPDGDGLHLLKVIRARLPAR